MNKITRLLRLISCWGLANLFPIFCLVSSAEAGQYQHCYPVQTIRRIIIFLLTILIINVAGEVAIAEAVTMNFQWTGEKGYSAKVVFSYDEQVNSAQIIEESRGKAKIIQDLTVSFYNPAGQSLGSYDNIKQGVSQFPYFKFNFDPQKQQVTGLIDLGGASSGEIYLKGIVEENLKLFKIDQSGKETIYDQNINGMKKY